MLENLENDLIRFLLDRKIKVAEDDLYISDLRKAKIIRFIIDLLFDEATSMDFGTKLNIVYRKHHEYNKHPYTYGGNLSVDKIYVHSINMDHEYLIQTVHKLTA